jgi:hypothetical protein
VSRNNVCGHCKLPSKKRFRGMLVNEQWYTSNKDHFSWYMSKYPYYILYALYLHTGTVRLTLQQPLVQAARQTQPKNALVNLRLFAE